MIQTHKIIDKINKCFDDDLVQKTVKACGLKAHVDLPL